LLVSLMRNQGRCQCGWRGKRRWLRGFALVDVFEHARDTGHLPTDIEVNQTLHMF
jgi:cobalamin biosynthesis protein CbiG